jgi:hypothetical protein
MIPGAVWYPQVVPRLSATLASARRNRALAGEKRIGAPGFEPGTSCSQSRRATRLRHAPPGRVYGRSDVRPAGIRRV